jgi:hypothetical protein
MNEVALRLRAAQALATARSTITRMRKRGYTFAAIANKLNRQGYVAKDGAEWTRHSVQAYVKR